MSHRRFALLTAFAIQGCSVGFAPLLGGTAAPSPGPGVHAGPTPVPEASPAASPTAVPTLAPTPAPTPLLAAYRIQAFAGDASGSAGNSRDGDAADSALFAGPAGIAIGTSGAVFLADYQNHVVRKIDGGVVSTVAGWGAFGFAGDGGPARDAQLSRPFGVAVGPADQLAIADYGNDRVRVVDAAGIIRSVAGGGAATPSTGVDATASVLAGPAGVGFAPDGTLYVAEFVGHRVSRVAGDGTLEVVAGTGLRGDGGDGGPGASAELYQPVAVLPDALGGCWIADFGNNRVRHVDPAGTIRTIAGTGDAGSNGDGGPASAAQLNGPAALALAPDGALLVADMGNNKIRAIGADGVIRTVAGTGRKGNSGDGGPALAADLDSPVGLAVLEGRLVVADFGNNRLRVLTSP